MGAEAHTTAEVVVAEAAATEAAVVVEAAHSETITVVEDSRSTTQAMTTIDAHHPSLSEPALHAEVARRHMRNDVFRQPRSQLLPPLRLPHPHL